MGTTDNDGGTSDDNSEPGPSVGPSTRRLGAHYTVTRNVQYTATGPEENMPSAPITATALIDHFVAAVADSSASDKFGTVDQDSVVIPAEPRAYTAQTSSSSTGTGSSPETSLGSIAGLSLLGMCVAAASITV